MSFTIPMLAEVDAGADDPALLVLEDGTSLRGEAFGLAVERFSDSNNQLMAALERIEGALGKTLARSDDQLAYYVAQAREIIDLSIMSQRQIVDGLQQLPARQAAQASEA